MAFSTKDKDQDKDSKNCVVEGTGAWWYDECNSNIHLIHSNSNLNGKNYGLAWAYKSDMTSMYWKGFPQSDKFISLKTITMALRKQ